MAPNVIIKAPCFSLFSTLSPSFPSFSPVPSSLIPLLFPVHAHVLLPTVLSLSLTISHSPSLVPFILPFLSLALHRTVNLAQAQLWDTRCCQAGATAPLTRWPTSSPGRGGPALSLALADRAETHTDSVEPDETVESLQGECVDRIQTLKQDQGLTI